MSKKCDEYPAIHVGRVVFTKSVVQAITAPKLRAAQCHRN